ncbi:MAG: hypothetical protein ABMB14_20785 [Myxococcota bacterium]
MTTDRPGVTDPGPPPERGLVVRPTRSEHGGDGFYARIQPRPPLPWGWWAGAMSAITAAGAGLAWGFATDGWLRAEIFASIVGFGVLLLGFAHGAGYFPVELTVDDLQINVGGERFARSSVTDCVADGTTLRLVGEGGRVLIELGGVDPDAARWLSLAIRASL